MSKTWKILPKVSDDLRTQLLSNREIKTPKKIEEFFNPKLENYKSDLEISGIKNTQKRIQKAIESQELIVVYGDYDVDGISACTILYKGLTSIGAKVLPYIPHREKEGYGLSNIGLEFARDSGATLVITVDNGIVALEQAKFAKELGLDLVITDHHLPLEKLPEAFEIVHSIKMCGAAVAWCLIKDLISEDLRKDLLQFTAIATVCDMIPLIGLGRAFVFEGLKVLNHSKNLGLNCLIKECGINSEISAYEIGHVIGPRLNAIGRLEHAIDALRLLCTQDEVKARRLAKLLCESNSKRQILTTEAVDQARVLVSKNSHKKIHILDSSKWAPGIIGLIATRVTEEFFRPSIAISVGDKIAKGSARSIEGVNIVELIRGCSDLLIDVGGHKGAAGFSLEPKNVDAFRQKLEKIMDGVVIDEEKSLEIEAEVESKNLTKTLVKELEEFEPFGFGNPKPLFATRNMKLSDIRTLSEGKHLKFKADGIDAIAFGLGDLEKLVSNNQLVNVAYFLEINKYNGYENLQLKVRDINFI